ncbi:hypothetical protein Bbelb_151700 [Branchiostoma belcheri]|nr:hypothetical protein Bbelb_151700 [Branchiostoma belcheri]
MCLMATVQQYLGLLVLEQDVIEPSTSPWASPVVIVTKKDGTPRFCVDFRKLNSVTVPDAHPLPRIDDTIDALAGSYYFSTLDMKSAYWQVPVHPADRHKTAFCTAEGLWQFKVLPFGLSNSAATYQRLVQLILAGVGWDVCLAYLDDIIVFTPTFDEHLHTLQEVFTRLRQAGLKLHPAKCRFAQKEVTFLGHVVSRRGVAPDPDNIAKVQGWPTPSNQTDIRSFLGLASFYRKFVPAFATVAEPLVRLTDKHHNFQWNPACQSAFDTLKHQLTSPPILAFPDFTREFTLATDASNTGIGAVLTQEHGTTRRVVAYASKTLSRSQRRWCTYDQEFWAAVWAVRHFRPYLYGHNFTLLTDHRPLLSCGKSHLEMEWRRADARGGPLNSVHISLPSSTDLVPPTRTLMPYRAGPGVESPLHTPTSSRWGGGQGGAAEGSDHGLPDQGEVGLRRGWQLGVKAEGWASELLGIGPHIELLNPKLEIVGRGAVE